MTAIPYVALAAILVWAAPHMAHAEESCVVSVDGRATYDRTDADGNPRNNPDHTVYPNDVFGFEFSYRFSGGCIDPHVGTVRDSGAVQKTGVSGPEGRAVPAGSGSIHGDGTILVGPANECHGAPPAGGGGEDGYDTEFGEPRRCGELSLTVWAYRLVCGEVCHLVRVSATDTIYPAVVAPITHLNMEQHMLHDMQGYPAVNLDATYYAWDPAGIIHRAVFEHKDHRGGTVSFRYDREHPILHEEGGFGCDHKCRTHLEPYGTPAGTGFLPYPGRYGNGDGAYAYAAPSGAPPGSYTVTYRVTVLNEGVPINSHRNSTHIDIVGYDPVFAHHPYTVLSDGAPRSYSDRQGVLLRYEGSAGADGAIHPDRRAKITNFYPHTVARSASALVEPHTIGLHIIQWNSTWAPPHTGGYDAAVERFLGVMDGSPSLPYHPLHTTSAGGCPHAISARHHPFGCHAMFLYAAHGAVRFWQDIHHTIVLERPHRWYENVTTYMGLASDDWAGRTQHILFNYTYVYPRALLAHNFTMVSSQDMPLEAHITPYGGASDDDTPGRTIIHTDRYIYEKTLHDTGDHTMAEMASSEVYPTTQYSAGSGSLRISLNKTALQFWDGALAARGYGSILDMDMHEALEFGAHHIFRLSAGPHARQFVAPFGFDVSRTERVHTGQDAAEVRRAGPGTVQFLVPYEFGTVGGLTVRGERHEYGGECHAVWCVANVGPGGGTIQVHNLWGGTASGTIPPYGGTPHVGDPTPHAHTLAAWVAPLAALVSGLWVCWRVISRMRADA